MVEKKRQWVKLPDSIKVIAYELYVKFQGIHYDPVIRELEQNHSIIMTTQKLRGMAYYEKWMIARNIYMNHGIFYPYEERHKYKDLPKKILKTVDTMDNRRHNKVLVGVPSTDYKKNDVEMKGKSGKWIPKKAKSKTIVVPNDKIYSQLCDISFNPKNLHLSLFRIMDSLKCVDFYDEYRQRYQREGLDAKRKELIRFYEEDMGVESRSARNQNVHLNETMMNQALRDEVAYMKGEPKVGTHFDYFSQKDKKRQRRLEPHHTDSYRTFQGGPQTAIQVNNVGGKTSVTESSGGAFDEKPLSLAEIEKELLENNEVIRQLERKLPKKDGESLLNSEQDATTKED